MHQQMYDNLIKDIRFAPTTGWKKRGKVWKVVVHLKCTAEIAISAG